MHILSLTAHLPSHVVLPASYASLSTTHGVSVVVVMVVLVVVVVVMVVLGDAYNPNSLYSSIALWKKLI